MSHIGLSFAINCGLTDPVEKLAIMGIGDVECDGVAVISTAAIAKWACCPEADVARIVASLEERGLIAAEFLGGAGGKFRITVLDLLADYEARVVERVDAPRPTPIPKSLRKAIYGRDGDNCRYCGAAIRDGQKTIDHVIPRSRGGGNTMGNLVVACRSCNCKKGARSLEDMGWSV